MPHTSSSRHALWMACAVTFISFNAHASRAYVSNEDGHSVTIIDTDRNEVVATVPVGKRPRGMKLSPDDKTLYIAVSGLPKCPPTVPDEECAKLERDLKADGIAVLDTTSLKVSKVIEAGSDPEQFDITADGKLMFVANEDTATATVLELPSGKIKARVAVGREPEGVRVSPDGKWVLVTNESDNSISVIDTRSLKVQRSIRVGERPRDIAFTPDSRTAFVSGEFDASLYRVGMPAGEPVEKVLQLRKEAKPMAVSLDAARDRLYVSTGRGGTVAILTADKPKLIAELPVGARPWGIALTQDGRRLYTANGPSNDVSVVDTEKSQVIKKIPVGRSPWTVVLSR